MDSNPLFLTGNTDTVYLSCVLNIKEDGPTMIEIPPSTGQETVNDAFFRFVTDTGAPGPDKGQGGKYLILRATTKQIWILRLAVWRRSLKERNTSFPRQRVM